MPNFDTLTSAIDWATKLPPNTPLYSILCTVGYELHMLTYMGHEFGWTYVNLTTTKFQFMDDAGKFQDVADVASIVVPR